MKTLMITTAVSALMLGAAACSQSADSYDVAEAPETQSEVTMDAELADTEMTDADSDLMDGDARMDAGATVYMADTELRAEQLIGATVTGIDGEDIATVDDLLINTSGEVESIIFKSGDFIDAVGTKGAIAYDQMDLTITADQEPRFTVAMTEEAIQNVGEFEQDGLNDYRLASELIGTTAGFTSSDDQVRIRDIVMNASGEVQYAVVSDPIMLDDKRQIDFDRIDIEQGDGGDVVIRGTKADLEAMPRFEYSGDTDPMSPAEPETDDTMTPQ